MSGLGYAITKYNLGLGTNGELPEEFSSGAYTGAGAFLDEYEDKKGRIRYKKGECAGAGLIHVCEPGLELKGPNLGAGFEETSTGVKAGAQAEVYSSSVSLGHVGVGAGALKAGAGFRAGEDGVGASIDATLVEVSGSVGPATGTLGLSADTGFGVGKDGVEAKFLGTGFKIGREIGFSVGGSGISFKLPW